MKVRNNNISYDKELSKFIEELDIYDRPHCFEDSNYIPKRCLLVKSMIKEELKRRNKI